MSTFAVFVLLVQSVIASKFKFGNETHEVIAGTDDFDMFAKQIVRITVLKLCLYRGGLPPSIVGTGIILGSAQRPEENFILTAAHNIGQDCTVDREGGEKWIFKDLVIQIEFQNSESVMDKFKFDLENLPQHTSEDYIFFPDQYFKYYPKNDIEKHMNCKGSGYDLALIKLPKNESIKLVGLAQEFNPVDIPVGSTVIGFGFGKNLRGNKPRGSRNFQTVAVSQCQDAVPQCHPTCYGGDLDKFDPNEVLCINTTSAKSYGGDSGSPLFVEVLDATTNITSAHLVGLWDKGSICRLPECHPTKGSKIGVAINLNSDPVKNFITKTMEEAVFDKN